MLENFVADLLRVIVVFSAAFNFFILVFFYERDGGARRKMIYSLSALLIAIGQLYTCINAFRGATEWPQAASQIGLTIIIFAALGSVRRAASFLIDHCGGCNAHKRS